MLLFGLFYAVIGVFLWFRFFVVFWYIYGMEGKRIYKGPFLGKDELAGLYNIHKDTLKRRLKPIQHKLFFFFTRQQTITPIDLETIFNYLGEPNTDKTKK